MIVLITQYTIEIVASGRTNCSRFDLFESMLPHVLLNLLESIASCQKEPHLSRQCGLFSKFLRPEANDTDDPSTKYVFYQNDEVVPIVPCQRHWKTDFDIVLQTHLHYILWLAADLSMDIKRIAFHQQFGQVKAKRSGDKTSNLHQDEVMTSIILDHVGSLSWSTGTLPYLASEIYPNIYGKPVKPDQIIRTKQQKQYWNWDISVISCWSPDRLPLHFFCNKRFAGIKKDNRDFGNWAKAMSQCMIQLPLVLEQGFCDGRYSSKEEENQNKQFLLLKDKFLNGIEFERKVQIDTKIEPGHPDGSQSVSDLLC
jgi:hypothetical protein